MFRNMAVSLIEHGRITTTLHKAKELRVVAEKLVTLGKNDSLHARRLAFDRLRSRDAVQKLFATIAPAFKTRKGGYTRILKLDTRLGDAAQLAIIEYLREDLPADASHKPTKSDKAKKAKTGEGASAAEPKAKKVPKVKKEAKPKAEKKPDQPKAKHSTKINRKTSGK
jgi:large subunit ribosomal protein L17